MLVFHILQSFREYIYLCVLFGSLYNMTYVHECFWQAVLIEFDVIVVIATAVAIANASELITHSIFFLYEMYAFVDIFCSSMILHDVCFPP